MRPIDGQPDESWRGDADHRVDRRADLQFLAEDIAALCVARLPEGVAEYHHRLARRWLIFRRGEIPPEHGRSVEEVEEARAHDADLHLARGIADANGHGARRIPRRPREGRRPLRQIDVSRVAADAADVLRAAIGLRRVDPVRQRGITE
jgi:hypothetical protein